MPDENEQQAPDGVLNLYPGDEGERSIYARKRSREQREADLCWLAERMLRPYTQVQLTNELNANRPYKMSRIQIRTDILEIEDRWAKSILGNTSRRKAAELQKLAYIEMEAFEAWNKSKQDFTEQSQTQTGSASSGDVGSLSGAEVTRKVVRKTSCGDPAFLNAIIKISERRCKILGLDVPSDETPNGPDSDAVTLDRLRTAYRSRLLLGPIQQGAVQE